MLLRLVNFFLMFKYVFEGLNCIDCKIKGMMVLVGIIEVVVEVIWEYKFKMVVVDLVMVVMMGLFLLFNILFLFFREKFVFLVMVFMFNLFEVRLLFVDVGFGYLLVEKVSDLEGIVRVVGSLGLKWVLIKGGYCFFNGEGMIVVEEGKREKVVDVFWGRDEKGGEVLR